MTAIKGSDTFTSTRVRRPFTSNLEASGAIILSLKNSVKLSPQVKTFRSCENDPSDVTQLKQF